MGVYIKGMEMPKVCGQCQIKLGIDCELWRHVRSVSLGRHKNCPLIPVPTPHGRLIDAGALTISTAAPLDGKPYQYVHIDNIKAAPTIIEAEEES